MILKPQSTSYSCICAAEAVEIGTDKSKSSVTFWPESTLGTPQYQMMLDLSHMEYVTAPHPPQLDAQAQAGATCGRSPAPQYPKAPRH